MNLVIIGNNTDDIALEIWQGNTNFTVLNQNPYLMGKNFIEYIKNKEVIVSTNTDQFEYTTANMFLEWLEKYEFIPIFIADNKDDFVCSMYTLIDDIVPDAVLFTRNEKNEGYDELIKIAREYLFKRKERDGDKTVRTPRKRKASTPKK